jgi:alkaline phosphatase
MVEVQVMNRIPKHFLYSTVVFAIGLVTTSRVTDASPAGVFANAANRDWETNWDVIEDNGDPSKCRDITHQLVLGDVGKRLKV